MHKELKKALLFKKYKHCVGVRFSFKKCSITVNLNWSNVPNDEKALIMAFCHEYGLSIIMDHVDCSFIWYAPHGWIHLTDNQLINEINDFVDGSLSDLLNVLLSGSAIKKRKLAETYSDMGVHVYDQCSHQYVPLAQHNGVSLPKLGLALDWSGDQLRVYTDNGRRIKLVPNNRDAVEISNTGGE